MGVITTLLGSVINTLQPQAFWAVKLRNGTFRSELDRRPPGRAFDWTLDLVDTGEVHQIRELWLICPPNRDNPLGQTARLPLRRPGTAFQLKVGMVHGMGETSRTLVSQLIGRVDDPLTGACTCFVWDADLRSLGTWQSAIYPRLGSWRAEIAPIGVLNEEILGLSLG